MSLKIKILMLAILPLLLVTAMITVIVLHQARELGEQEIQIFESNLLASKKTELKHYVDLALTSISHVHDLPKLDPTDAQAQVKSILHNLTFGEDGYFFVYDDNGVGLVHPQQPDIVGRSLIDIRDENGEYLMRKLLASARAGGGYHRYRWRKPSLDGEADKLSYVVQLPNWKWMLGTGLYVDDIAHEVAKIRAEVDKDIRETFITVLVITSVTVVIIVLIGVAFNLHGHLMADAKLRDLAQRYIQFQIAERRRFSRELHEGINQLMVSVQLRIEQAIRRIDEGDSAVFEDLQQGQLVLNDAIQEVRRISHDLRPSVLDDLGLPAALNSLLEQFSQRTDIRVQRTIEIDNNRLPEQIEITLYRVVQESLKNIEQHADASVIRLVITQVDDMIRLEISDNGCGFTPEEGELTQGAGLITMRERVELLGGIFSTASEPGNGTLLKAEMNLNG
ncbi:cache domain-containing protein [Motiliproteus sp. MSK22-1]|uniref:cache domain-containing protein n=1 Tax=Motiliproteus sp. MSK22-1 TaxID=1897630 RepID=UPI000977D8F6|nr:cache domain-containing protein [Motiliproteus sp. MSK22-1]OMH30534.1 histidine kinase [Motiliproteus sp. MSK22-1]